MFSCGKIESFFTIVVKHGLLAQCESLFVRMTSTAAVRIRGAMS
jgi:hypothetical protein